MSQEIPSSQLAREYEILGGLFDTQPKLTQLFLNRQAAVLADALENNRTLLRFTLPDQVVLDGGEKLGLPAPIRKRIPSGSGDRRVQLTRSLADLEGSLNPGLSTCARLLRYALARHLLYQVIPEGRSFNYQPESGDDIPSIPAEVLVPSALTARSDAVAEAGESGEDMDRLVVPFVESARRFYLPQWVAFGENDRLLRNSFPEAKACVRSLEKAVRILQEAADLCPGIVTDPTYQRKRAGLMGQLVNQGRAMARALTCEIINRIRNRAAAGSLNRGLSLSLPYFNDDNLSLQVFPIEVIPSGRIMFIPAFVSLAMRQAEAKVQNDFQLNYSTRKYLLKQLASIELAFNGHTS